MKTVLFVSLLLLFALPSFSQHSQLNLSNDFKIKETEYADQTISHSIHHNNYFYSVTNDYLKTPKWLFTKLYDVKFPITLSKFDRDMKLLKEVKLENGADIFGPLSPELIFFNNQLYLVSFKNNNASSFNFYIAPVNENDLSLGEAKLVSTIQQENLGAMKIASFFTAGLAYFTTSQDNSKLLVACKSAPNMLHTTVFDAQLNIVTQARTQVGLAEFDIPSAVLTIENNSLLVLNFEKETRIMGINSEGKKTETKYQGWGDFIPHHTKATIARDGKTIYIYSTTNHPSKFATTRTNGMLISKIDPITFKASKPLVYEFNQEFTKSISLQGGGEKNRKDYYLYKFIPNLIELDNGTIAITGSPQDISTTFSPASPNSKSSATTITKTGPVIIFYPNTKGNSFEHVIVPRRISVSRTNMGGSGAIQIVQSPIASIANSGYLGKSLGDDILIIYSDNETNLIKGEGEKLVTTRSAGDLSLAEAVINKDKKLEYRKLVGKNQQKGFSYYLGNTVPSSTSSLIFPVGKVVAGMTSYKTIFTNWCFLDVKP